GDQHGVAGVERVDRLALEVVERERVRRREAGAEPLVDDHCGGLVCDGAVEAGPDETVDPVAPVAPGLVVGVDGVVGVLVGVVVGSGSAAGATSWRSNPPGQNTPTPTVQMISTTNEIVRTARARRRRTRLPRRSTNQATKPPTTSAPTINQLARGCRLITPPVAGMPAGPGRSSQISSAVPRKIAAATPAALKMPARLRRLGNGWRRLREGLIVSSTARPRSRPRRRCTWGWP